MKIDELKKEHTENERKIKEDAYRKDKDAENTETIQIIEEIIEGISLQNRRGTIVRTISAVIR